MPKSKSAHTHSKNTSLKTKNRTAVARKETLSNKIRRRKRPSLFNSPRDTTLLYEAQNNTTPKTKEDRFKKTASTKNSSKTKTRIKRPRFSSFDEAPTKHHSPRTREEQRKNQPDNPPTDRDKDDQIGSSRWSQETQTPRDDNQDFARDYRMRRDRPTDHSSTTQTNTYGWNNPASQYDREYFGTQNQGDRSDRYAYFKPDEDEQGYTLNTDRDRRHYSTHDDIDTDTDKNEDEKNFQQSKFQSHRSEAV